MTQNPTTSPWLLALVTDSPEIQQLIVAWPNLYEDLVVGKGMAVSRDNGALVAEWASRCGMRSEEVRQLWNKMFAYGFVNEDGTSNDTVCRFIANIALAQIKPSKPKGAK